MRTYQKARRSNLFPWKRFSQEDKLHVYNMVTSNTLEIASSECTLLPGSDTLCPIAIADVELQRLRQNNPLFVIKRVAFADGFIKRVTFGYAHPIREPICLVGVIQEAASTIKEAVIPDGVDVIGPAAFHDCNRLERVVIPDTVHIVCRLSFLRCRRLISLSLPEHLKLVAPFVFAGCTKLKGFFFHPPRGTAHYPFIMWAVGTGKNRSNFDTTKIKNLRNVLALIAILAGEHRQPSTIVAQPKHLGVIFAGCREFAKWNTIFNGMTLNCREYCTSLFDVCVSNEYKESIQFSSCGALRRQIIISSKRKPQKGAQQQSKKVRTELVSLCIRVCILP